MLMPVPAIGKVRAKFPHIPVLDGIRAVAVMIVFVALAGLDRIVPGGFGVTIFFFLSGYLITSLLRVEYHNTDKISLKDFYIRRILRIFPPLYITLGIVTILAAVGLFAEPIKRGWIYPEYIFVANYPSLLGNPGKIPNMGTLWSLAVEEHFYLFFPLLFGLVIRNRTGKKVAFWLFSVCAVVLLWRWFNTIRLPDFGRNYYTTDSRIDSILFGSILAMCGNPALDGDRAYRPKAWHLAAALALLLFCFVFRSNAFRESFRYSLQGIAFLPIFAWLLAPHDSWVHRALAARPVRYMGLISYSFYLAHFAVLAALKDNTNLSLPVVGVLGFGITFAYCSLLLKYVEKPATNLRHKFRHVAQPGEASPELPDKAMAPIAESVSKPVIPA